MKYKKSYIMVRPSYYRGNFDYGKEGPYNRLNDSDINDEQMVLDKEKLDKIKQKDIVNKKEHDMKIYEETGYYPDTSSPAPKNEIFKNDRSFYEDLYTTRETEIKKNKPKIQIMAEKKIKKLAVIRDDDAKPCPMGLPIPTACCNVGESIYRMAPTENMKDEKRKKVKRANELVYLYAKTGKRCPFADGVMVDFDKVNCDWGDTAQGIGGASFVGSPIYPSTFSGIGLDALYSNPGSFYGDSNLNRNLFLGLFSLLGQDDTIDQIIKLADECDSIKEDKLASELDSIVEDIAESNEEERKEKLERLKEILNEYKEKYKDDNISSGMLWELLKKWNMGRP